MRRRLLRLLLWLLVLGAGAWLIDNRLFVKRYVSFVAAGYDPQTAPVAWYEPQYPLRHGAGSTLPAAPPAERTIPAAAISQAVAYAEAQDSLALIIARHGRIELERYWDGADRETLFNPQSMSKTVGAMLTGIALAEGAIESLDTPVERYLPEWRGDPRGRMTIRHLLTMSGGLAQIATDYRPVLWSRGTWQHFGTDFNGPILQLPLADPPGTRFEYNNNENNLLGLVLERATGTAYPEYLADKLWIPLDLGPAFMYADRPGGSVMKSCCILSRPIDWLTLGQLVLDEGWHAGRQVLPAGWVEQMLTPAATFPGYGFQIWLTVGITGQSSTSPPASTRAWWASEPYATDRIAVFLGFGFQHVWVIPELELVIVRANRVWPREPWDQARIPNLLIRALQQGLPARRRDEVTASRPAAG